MKVKHKYYNFGTKLLDKILKNITTKVAVA